MIQTRVYSLQHFTIRGRIMLLKPAIALRRQVAVAEYTEASVRLINFVDLASPRPVGPSCLGRVVYDWLLESSLLFQ